MAARAQVAVGHLSYDGFLEKVKDNQKESHGWRRQKSRIGVEEKFNFRPVGSKVIEKREDRWKRLESERESEDF